LGFFGNSNCAPRPDAVSVQHRIRGLVSLPICQLHGGYHGEEVEEEVEEEELISFRCASAQERYARGLKPCELAGRADKGQIEGWHSPALFLWRSRQA
jgi:hypothetical protein